MQIGLVVRARGRHGAPVHQVRPAAACGVALALAVAALIGSGCGIAGGTPSLGPTTTQAPSQAKLTVDPAEGPIGTVFTLSGQAITPGAAVQFEITFPGEGRAYPGSALVVGDDGTATATYRATTANQPGLYVVRLTGPQGELGSGEFRVTDGKPLISSTTAKSTATSGSGKVASTVKGATSSSKPSTTAKPGTTAPPATTAPPKTTIPATIPPAPTTSPPTSAPPAT
jgi:hypothetical protein